MTMAASPHHPRCTQSPPHRGHRPIRPFLARHALREGPRALVTNCRLQHLDHRAQLGSLVAHLDQRCGDAAATPAAVAAMAMAMRWAEALVAVSADAVVVVASRHWRAMVVEVKAARRDPMAAAHRDDPEATNPVEGAAVA